MRLKILLAIFIFSALPTFAEPPAQVRISPTGFVSQRRVTAHISVHIDRNADNRAATLELISEDYYSRSDFEVEGEAAQISWQFERRDLEAGNYVAYLTLHKLVEGKWKDFTCQSEKLTVLP